MILNKRMVSGDLDILRFLFPRYEVIDQVKENPKVPCIFTGNLSDIDRLKEISTIIEKSDKDPEIYLKEKLFKRSI